MKDVNTKRTQDIIEILTEENRQLRENRLPREYTFVPIGLTSEEQEIVGSASEGRFAELVTKWFKSQADKNNDLLIHGHSLTVEQQALFKTAVLMYEDWFSFLQNCRGVYNRNNK